MAKQLTLDEKFEIMSAEMSVSWEQLQGIMDAYSGYDSNIKRSWGKIWAQAKYPLFVKFGNKLKLTKDVENTVSPSEVYNLFTNNVLRELENQESDMTQTEIENIFLYFKDFDVEELKTNRLSRNRDIRGIKIQKGAKISKSLKLLIDSESVRDKLQIAMSMFNESLLSRGRLEVSIDPIDILMMSKNATRDWVSCHNIFDGCYGAGAVSYLLDSSSVIAQVVLNNEKAKISETDKLIPDKTWRRMLMFNTDLDAIFISRSYPSSNKNNTATMISLLEETFGADNMAHSFVDSDWARHRITDQNSCHYNDISHHALNKVYTIILDKNKYGVEGKNKMEDTLRSLQSTTLQGLEFLVGHDGPVPSADGTYDIDGEIEELGMFDEDYYYDNDDDYYDEDEEY